MSRVEILNGEFDPVTLGEAADQVMDRVKSRRRGWASTVNTAILMMMRRNAFLQQYVDRSALIVADGQPLIWASRLLSTPLPERVAGVDLVVALCERAAAADLGVYFLGAQLHVVEQLAKQLREQVPGLRVCGVANGYFGPEESAERAKSIASSGARILFVGMGVPRQEQFLEREWESLGVDFALGVGGSFDVLAGLRSRAPEWMQRTGLEWVYRIILEPRRLFRRYLTTNSQFLFLISQSLLLRKARSSRGNK